MRTLGLASLSIASCIFFFAACSSDDATPEAGPDGGTSSSGSSGSSTGTSGASSGGTSSGGTSGGPGDDDDTDGGTTDGGDAGDAGDGGPVLPDARPPSCKGATGSGITTCGATEAANDDCCKSLTLPKTAKRTLDKYEITAGRMRKFITANPNVRKFAKDFAAANPKSQLGTVATGFPAKGDFGSYLDTLPNGAPNADKPLDEALFLGAFPIDTINTEDGCFVGKTGDLGYGSATYWQPPSALKPYSIGNAEDGVRKYGQEELDKKSLNCVSAYMLAAFCAWDGGELARTSDYYEVWRHDQVPADGPGGTGAKVTIPWTDVLPWGQFNWRNGHDGACPKGWPGCVKNPGIFFSEPKPQPNPTAGDDDTPEIGAPGRFPKDVTKATSPDGGGWYDLGGNLMDLAWPNDKQTPTQAAKAVQDFCDTSADNAGLPAAQKCTRVSGTRAGVLRYDGAVPQAVLVGSSFEVHFNRAQEYFASATDDESKIVPGDYKPLHFQYGKIGGRCARVK